MRLPFPYVRWDRASPVDGDDADFVASRPAGCVVNGHSGNGHDAHRAETSTRWMERVEAALREEGERIAADRTRDLAVFDKLAAEMASAISDYRGECAAIIEKRCSNGNSRAD